ncbi:MAG: hypothetical protein JWL69_2788 [Phycisphaerales bacterium]|nr:hypothetical protein [Phycisphaerales bacterium]MDB5355467.1 hypothetical protein [Phycisphaerales bacterium]
MARAYISWVPLGEGGRRRPPAGPVYSTIAYFEGDENWPKQAWSVVLRFVRPLNGGQCLIADVDFAVPEAPAALLGKGSRFELLEGRHRVAKGVVWPGLC